MISDAYHVRPSLSNMVVSQSEQLSQNSQVVVARQQDILWLLPSWQLIQNILWSLESIEECPFSAE